MKGAKLMNPAKLLDKTTTEHVGSKPFRAYMADNSSAPAAGARMFSISVGGSTTAIEQLETTADSKAEYYDLQGRRLQNLQKGINIVKRGGKTMKVITGTKNSNKNRYEKRKRYIKPVVSIMEMENHSHPRRLCYPEGVRRGLQQ